MIYELTISYLGQSKKGDSKTVKESYIDADAELFADVENSAYGAFAAGRADFEVIAIKRSKIREIANKRTCDDDKVFVATLVDVFLQDDGMEKETKYTIAFFAKDINGAHAFIRDYALQGYNMSITEIKETSFVDVL